MSRIQARKWNELSSVEKRTVALLLGVDLVGKATAWHFLYHLPAPHIRGPKWVWALVTSLVGTVGPLTFLLGGIKRR